MNDTARAGELLLPRHLYDGFEVHRAVLAKGLNVLALPRQVLLASKGEPVPAQISFTHAVPESSTLSGVTFAQDQRLRRALVQRAGVQVPDGATFTWRSVSQAQEWAKRTGFPIVVKDAAGENPSRAIGNVHDGDELRAAFQTLRMRRPEDRSPGSNPHVAGYAATRLGYVVDDYGNEVAPLRTRMLVEKQIPGCVVRAAVVDGAVVSAIIYAQDAVAVERPVETELSSEIQSLIIRAAEAIPGMGFAIVDAVIDGEPSSAKNAVVAEVGERPRLSTFATADPLLPRKVAEAIVKSQADKAGLALDRTLETIEGHLYIEGLRSAQDDVARIINEAGRLGLELSEASVDDTIGSVSVKVNGTPETLATVVEHLMAGTLIDDRAMSAEFNHGGAQ